MTMTVTSDESLLIRVYNGEYVGDAAQDLIDETSLLDASTYRNSLSIDDIIASSQYSLFNSFRLVPVTAAANSSYLALDGKNLKTMDVLSKALTTTATANTGAGNYIEMKFWVMAQVTDENIVLSDLSITVDGSNDLVSQDNVVNAVNLAIWKSQVKDVVLDGTGSAESAKVFSINPDYGFAFMTGMNGADSDPLASAPFLLTPAQITALLDAHAVFYGTADEAHVSVADVTQATTLAALTADTPTLITVRIYIEGWDAQMTNAVLASKFDISFSFEIKNAA
jgi:hypothetical protein